jgi:hypothetical protein
LSQVSSKPTFAKLNFWWRIWACVRQGASFSLSNVSTALETCFSARHTLRSLRRMEEEGEYLVAGSSPQSCFDRLCKSRIIDLLVAVTSPPTMINLYCSASRHVRLLPLTSHHMKLTFRSTALPPLELAVQRRARRGLDD